MRPCFILTLVALVGCSVSVPPTAPPTPPAATDAPKPSAPEALTTPRTPASLPSSDDVISRIAFGSCNGQDEDQSHWAAIAATNPDLFLFIGDNVYGDRVDGVVIKDPKPDLPKLQRAYQQFAAQPAWQDFYAAVPVIPTWDDHDYGLNDAGADFPHKERSEQIFLDFWQVPAEDPRRSHPGVYTAASFGPEGKRTQIILLDTRTFREDLVPMADGGRGYQAASTGTMLGEAQWAWLEQVLAEPADLRIVASSIQVISQNHPWERWDTFPAERTRLLERLASAGPTVLLSGDRHIGGVYATKVGETELVELTSSSLNKDFVREAEVDAQREGAAETGRNFGLVNIDWTSRTLQLALRDETGAALPQIVGMPFGDGS